VGGSPASELEPWTPPYPYFQLYKDEVLILSSLLIAWTIGKPLHKVTIGTLWGPWGLPWSSNFSLGALVALTTLLPTPLEVGWIGLPLM
jgi:hypothetical protein